MGRGQSQTVEGTKSRGNYSAKLRAQAAEITEELVAEGASAVVLFGSAARGQAKANSDLDLLVVWEDQPKRVRDMKFYKQAKNPKLLGLSHAKWDELAEPGKRWSFFKTIAGENEYLHDPQGKLAAAFAALPEPNAEERKQTIEYLQKNQKALDKMINPDVLGRYGNSFYFLYHHLYKQAKVAMLEANIFQGTYGLNDRQQAWQLFAERNPDLKDEVACLVRAEPFYLRNKGKGDPAYQVDTSSKEELLKTMAATQAVTKRACKEIA